MDKHEFVQPEKTGTLEDTKEIKDASIDEQEPETKKRNVHRRKIMNLLLVGKKPSA